MPIKKLIICDVISNDIVAIDVLKYIKKVSPDVISYIEEHLQRLLFTASYVKKTFNKSIKILDIGSGVPFLPGYLNLNGFENINTIDIGKFPFDTPWKVQSCMLDIEEQPLPYADEFFDLVLLLEVFEHLYKRPNHVFREIQRVLKQGGTLVISTPNGGEFRRYLRCLLNGKFGMPIYDFSSVYEKLGHFTHIREYSIYEIKNYLNHFDFSIKKIIFNSFLVVKILNDWQVRYTRNKIKIFAGIIRKIFWFLPTFQTNIFLIANKR